MKSCKKCKAFSLALPRITTAILFLFAGLSKLFVMTPVVFATGMITPNFGFTGGFALVVAWLVILGEIVGGLSLLVGKMIPAKLYRTFIRVLMLILLGAIIFVHGRNGDVMGVLKNLVILSVLISLCHTKPICPMGLTGHKCDGDTCEL